MYPYEDALITAEVTGNRILAFLESAVTDKFKGIDPLLASGITYKYDSSKPEGQRIVSVTIGDKTYNPMELFQARVTVAMDSYLYYAKFSQRSKLKGKRGNIYNCLVDYLDKKPSVRDATPLGTDIHESSFAVGQEEKEQVRKKKLRELLKEMNPTLFNQKFLETL
ncbi:MAG: bifunctional 2',3'-cyclic nucleotide 2'-phosphodiesterase/3'-nucleotidase precursor protein [bacterium ADurb.Bin363]|nr:MAG: bifunctional 2',3'-cyclic nucleotide 2'-phosphodiesterase/3'-nucleotidase precursor protein [bacterium ADurb.Bin363]